MVAAAAAHSFSGTPSQVAADLEQQLVKPYVALDNWSSYTLQLSIDGHGSAARLPQQLLQGVSVILKMQSPYQDW